MNHDRVIFVPEIQGWFNQYDSTQEQIKDKNHIILLIETEKALDNSTSSHLKKKHKKNLSILKHKTSLI